MSLKKVHENQPKDFKFSIENLKKAEEILKNILKRIKKVQLCLFFIWRKNKMITGYHSLQ